MAVDKLSDNFQLVMRTLSPVHVGAGKEKWLNRNLDYFIENRKVVVVDAEKFMARLMDAEADGGVLAYEKFCRLHSKTLEDMDDQTLDLLEESDITLPEITKHKLDYTSNPANVIHTLIRDGFGQPILPGTSVKGAVRSAIFHFLHDSHRKYNYEQMSKWELDKVVFGDFDKEQLMRFIRPCDVKVLETLVQNVDLFYVSTDTKKSKIDEQFKNSLSLEVIPAGAEMNFDLALASDEWLGEIKKQENLTNSELEKKHHQRKEKDAFKPSRFLHKKWGEVLKKGAALQKLFEIINKATHAHLEREIKFYKDFPQSPGTDQIIADLEIWKKKTENSTGSCVLRLGAGSGFHSMTGEWRFDDHSSTIDNPDVLNEVPFRSGGKHPAPYKTRKWAMQAGVYQTLGFVEIFLPGAEADEQPILEMPDAEVAAVETPDAAEFIQIEATPPQNPKPVELPKSKDYNLLKIEKDKTVLDAEVVRIARPFSKVRLLIDNYPFPDTFADLMGAKNVPLIEGSAVRVLVRQLTKEGKISNVSLYQH